MYTESVTDIGRINQRMPAEAQTQCCPPPNHAPAAVPTLLSELGRGMTGTHAQQSSTMGYLTSDPAPAAATRVCGLALA